MGAIENKTTGQKIELARESTIGRDRFLVLCHTANGYASSLHARLTWVDGVWHLRDISKNGTWLNGRRITAVHHVIQENDELRFGHPDADAWRVANTDPPRAFVLDLHTRDQCIAQQDLITLWDARVLRILPEFGLLRQGHGHVRIHHLEFVDREFPWRLYLPDGVETTAYFHHFDIKRLVLEVGRDKETPFAAIREGEGSLPVHLEYRAHWALVYELAKERKEDPTGEGWVDLGALRDRLGITPTLFAQWTFRTKLMLESHHVDGFDQIIQVEKRHRRCRIGVPQERIVIRNEGEQPT